MLTLPPAQAATRACYGLWTASVINRWTIRAGIALIDKGQFDVGTGYCLHGRRQLPHLRPILASAAGTVLFSGWCDCGLGYYVELDHGNGVTTIYGHMASQPFVSAGQQVAQGETIGPMGSTGLSTGPHVHFMLQINGVSQDPARYLE
jgi:hypothetical protein